MNRSQTILVAILGAILIVGAVLYVLLPEKEIATPEPVVDTAPETPAVAMSESIIGSSVEGRDIVAVSFGNGDTHLLFVGGMHGGYEWNSSLLAYEVIDYLTLNPTEVPEDLTITIIPSINPDGLAKVVPKDGPFTKADVPDPSVRVAEGRFNANGIDLNRNFDCKWAPESSWRGNTVSAGSGAFSEPEADALRNFVLENNPSAVVFWHSQANNVYASECTDGILPATLTLMDTYADAASYGKVESFDAYPITGDAEGWLASIGVPAVTVELEGFQTTEWERNLAGLNATLELYSTAK